MQTGIEMHYGFSQRYSIHAVSLGNEWRRKFPSEWVV